MSDSDDLPGTSEEEDDDEAAAAELGLDAAPPELYDPAADSRDERWVAKLRRGRRSDAVLSCPLCFTTVCVDCQAHATAENQFRAMFVMNCRVDTRQVVRPAAEAGGRRQVVRPAAEAGGRRQGGGKGAGEAEGPGKGAGRAAAGGGEAERYHPVLCAACGAELGLREVGPAGVYHFFHVVASNS